MANLYRLTVTSIELNTLGKYITAADSPAVNYSQDFRRFLGIVGEDNLTNGQRIVNTYKTAEQKNLLIQTGIIDNTGKILEPDKLPLRPGTVLYIESERANEVSFLVEGLQVVSTDSEAFVANQLAAIQADPGYKKITRPIPSQLQAGTSQVIYPNCRVWIWCRALSDGLEETEELTGQIFDLTPFIQNLTTNVTKGNGGNWQLTLPPIVCDVDEHNKWSLRRANMIQMQDEYLNEATMFEIIEGQLSRNQFLFNNIINSNDVIFIRYEVLEMERYKRKNDPNNYQIGKNQLPGNNFDLIGLVDATRIRINAETNDVTITVTGRDLSKLFLADGTYFFAYETSGGVVRSPGSTELKNSLLSRSVEEAGMQFIGLYNFTSIEKILKFVINQLANIKIVPNNLFSAYGDRRSTRFNEINFNPLNTNNNYKPQFKEEVANGIWQIFKLIIDESVAQRRLADTSFSTAQGALMNFINTAAQQPLCETIFDTYGDQYYLTVRKPPFDQKALISLIEGRVNTEEGVSVPSAIIDIEPDDVLEEMLIMNDNQCYSWYHFFPQAALINTSVDYATAIIPAIYFEEYGQIFGSRAFQQSHAYVPYVPMSTGGELGDVLFRQAYEDMKYVVESNQYLPFTRKGVIVINGDRRVKVGNVIRYKPTGEIFFVDSVQQELSINENVIDRRTTIHVSRGLVEQFIYGIHLANQDGTQRQYVSYFNLIDTRLNFTTKTVVKKETVQIKKGTKQVQRPVFSSLSGVNIPTNAVLEKPDMVKGIAYLKTYDSYPTNKNLFITFINQINKAGYSVNITSAVRSFAAQAALRELDKRNALPGTSKHEFGLAIDINITQVATGKSYLKNTSEAEWRSTGIPEIANDLGLRWAGPSNDGSFGGYVDRGHFEIVASTKTVTVDNVEESTKDVTQNVIDDQGVFTNYKVNKFTFNFFLKNLQFQSKFKKVVSRQVYNSDQAGTLPEVIIAGKAKKNGRK